MKFSTTTAACVLSVTGSALAAPLLSLDVSVNLTADDLAAKIALIAPSSVSCSAQFPECRNNTEVAPHFLDALKLYEIEAPGQIAGILALTAFESGNYQYKHNSNPDHHGQGTSNQQMADYNVKYAQSFPELKPQVDALSPVDTPDKQDQVLNLVVPDKYNFGSGPWFLKTQCAASVLTALAAGNDAGMNTYMGCVGASMTEDRNEYWTRAKAAFNLA
ncbi:hypothetical protein F4775DRAFT_596191 [Biscogniauxia sp. FL1348]|nr:hypothetical protein F4775DRAFT_596191 [Biscogniauxia sp. FL1348]